MRVVRWMEAESPPHAFGRFKRGSNWALRRY